MWSTWKEVLDVYSMMKNSKRLGRPWCLRVHGSRLQKITSLSAWKNSCRKTVRSVKLVGICKGWRSTDSVPLISSSPSFPHPIWPLLQKARELGQVPFSLCSRWWDVVRYRIFDRSLGQACCCIRILCRLRGGRNCFVSLVSSDCPPWHRSAYNFNLSLGVGFDQRCED